MTDRELDLLMTAVQTMIETDAPSTEWSASAAYLQGVLDTINLPYQDMPEDIKRDYGVEYRIAINPKRIEIVEDGNVIAVFFSDAPGWEVIE